MKSLIIGASGHLGAHLARELIADGGAVRALVRPTSDLRGLNGLDVEIAHGDVRDRESLIAAMAGCNHVYHLGSPTRVEPALFRTVVGGARRVLEVAYLLRIERVVYTSSFAAISHPEAGGYVFTEKDWASDNRLGDPHWTNENIDRRGGIAYAMGNKGRIERLVLYADR